MKLGKLIHIRKYGTIADYVIIMDNHYHSLLAKVPVIITAMDMPVNYLQLMNVARHDIYKKLV